MDHDDSLPLSLVQLLEFELGTKCNLGHVHHECPNLHPERYGSLDTSTELPDEVIVDCAVRAYRDLGFTGLVGWIYYNEPLLQADRMFALMGLIKAQVPQARFILWTNGMLIPEDCDQYAAFEQIVISGYNEQSRRGLAYLDAKGIDAMWCDNPRLDDRLQQITPAYPAQPCLRPFVEFIIDAYGNHHWCCYDWQGRGSLGNVLTTDFTDLARAWREQLPQIAGAEMTDQAPEFCRQCGHRWDTIQQHDEEIAAKAGRFHADLASQHTHGNAAKTRADGRVFLGIPTYDNTLHTVAMMGVLTATKTHPLQVVCNGSSLLAHGFNILWASAVASDASYFAMLHGDVGPDPNWIDTLIGELEATGADMVSAIIPIKSRENVYSTALAPMGGEATYRLHLDDLDKLPATFDGADLQRVSGKDGLLCVNTGCWVCRLGQDWNKQVHFAMVTEINWTGADAHCRIIPEDWYFSQRLHALGVKIVATQKVKVTHAGAWSWASHPKKSHG